MSMGKQKWKVNRVWAIPGLVWGWTFHRSQTGSHGSSSCGYEKIVPRTSQQNTLSHSRCNLARNRMQGVSSIFPCRAPPPPQPLSLHHFPFKTHIPNLLFPATTTTTSRPSLLSAPKKLLCRPPRGQYLRDNYIVVCFFSGWVTICSSANFDVDCVFPLLPVKTCFAARPSSVAVAGMSNFPPFVGKWFSHPFLW